VSNIENHITQYPILPPSKLPPVKHEPADASVRIKQEHEPDLPIKEEREPSLRFNESCRVKTRVYVEDGHEVTELFDSDEDSELGNASPQPHATTNEEVDSIYDDDATSDTVFSDTDDYIQSDPDIHSDSKSDISIESLCNVNSSDYVDVH
jgi:hypothetical protein